MYWIKLDERDSVVDKNLMQLYDNKSIAICERC